MVFSRESDMENLQSIETLEMSFMKKPIAMKKIFAYIYIFLPVEYWKLSIVIVRDD